MPPRFDGDLRSISPVGILTVHRMWRGHRYDCNGSLGDHRQGRGRQRCDLLQLAQAFRRHGEVAAVGATFSGEGERPAEEDRGRAGA